MYENKLDDAVLCIKYLSDIIIHGIHKDINSHDLNEIEEQNNIDLKKVIFIEKNFKKLILNGDLKSQDFDSLYKEIKIKIYKYSHKIKELQRGNKYIHSPNIDHNNIDPLNMYDTFNQVSTEFRCFLILKVIFKNNKHLIKPHQNKTQFTYMWQTNSEEDLPELYGLMKNHNLITQDTTIEQFKAIFNNQLVDENLLPVKWHDDNLSELIFFIECLKKYNCINSPKKTDYNKMKACFVKHDGKPFIGAFKSLKYSIDINLSEEKQKLIEGLVNKF